MVPYAYVHRMMGQGHSIPNPDIQSRHAIEYHFPLLMPGDRSTERLLWPSSSVSLCLFPSLLPLHILFKNFCVGEKSDDGQIVFFALRSLADVQRPEEEEGRLGRQKRREIKTKWNVLLSPGYPFYSYHNDNPPFLTCSRADGRSDGSGILFTTIPKVSLTAP